VAQGDVGAIGELYERHAKALLRFASRVAGTADAEDIVQSTFVRATKMAASYDGRSATGRAWLFGIAAHLVQERRRSLMRWASVVLRLRVERRALAAPSVHVSDIEKGLRQLSEAKRTVIVLAEIEGFACHEIARMLNVPIGTVWTRLHHARRELRKYYGEGV
jgi:RNA polymerase sigma factor (sigma-70 family)